jgi:hypothetical protein
LDYILLVESSNREISERLLPQLYSHSSKIDLFTCYRGEPKGFRPKSGEVWRTTDYSDPAAREVVFSEMAQRGYGAVGIICSGEPIMAKWKWMLAYRIPAKLFIINENCDYFFVDYSHIDTLLALVRMRLGLTGANAASTLGRLLIFPFSLLFLVLYAAWVHLQRKLRTA